MFLTPSAFNQDISDWDRRQRQGHAPDVRRSLCIRPGPRLVRGRRREPALFVLPHSAGACGRLSAYRRDMRRTYGRRGTPSASTTLHASSRPMNSNVIFNACGTGLGGQTSVLPTFSSWLSRPPEEGKGWTDRVGTCLLRRQVRGLELGQPTYTGLPWKSRTGRMAICHGRLRPNELGVGAAARPNFCP